MERFIGKDVEIIQENGPAVPVMGNLKIIFTDGIILEPFKNEKLKEQLGGVEGNAWVKKDKITAIIELKPSKE